MSARPAAADRFDVAAVRRLFPILARTVNGHPLVFLDSAASSQRPLPVMDAMRRMETTSYANVHRGVHTLSQEATGAYEGARAVVARFLGGCEPAEVIFTRGTTEAINLVAQSWGRSTLQAGDEVVVSALEHHSNLVPWQMVCAERRATLRVLPIDRQGDLQLGQAAQVFSPRTRLLAVTHVSNALGSITDLALLVQIAHAYGARVLVDGAQAAPHLAIDVGAIGCDFYAFSGHKAYGPTGIGVLWGRGELLRAMPPWQGGGEMITTVSYERAEYREPPQRFEAGTPNIVGAVGLAAALEFITGLGRERLLAHEHELVTGAAQALGDLRGVRLLGEPRERAAVVSFLVDGIHPHDVGTVLDQHGVAVRVGHHCAQPLMDSLGIPGTVRASFACYNTSEEIERLVAAVRAAQELFSGSRRVAGGRRAAGGARVSTARDNAR